MLRLKFRDSSFYIYENKKRTNKKTDDKLDKKGQIT